MPVRRSGSTSSVRRAPGVAAALAAVGLAVTACGGSSTRVPSDDNPAFAATATPAAGFAPLARAPREFRRIEGKGFTIDAPSAFQDRTRTAADGEPATVLEQASSVEGQKVAVVVLRDVDPEQDVVEQLYALEVSRRSLGADDVTRSDVTWPGARRAVLVTWTVDRPGTGGAVPTRFFQLGVQVDDDLILDVVGYAPVADVAAAQVETVLRTFRPSGAGA